MDSRRRGSSSTTATTDRRRAISGRSRPAGVGDGYLKFLGDPYQVGERRGLHLLHDVATVNLQRDLADAQLRGRLLVEQSADHERKHLAFPGREARETLSQG